MKRLFYPTVLAVTLLACGEKPEQTMTNPDNPFYQDYNTPYGVPPFDQIKDEHYMQAFEDGMKQHLKEVDAIANSNEEPTFENTIEAYEKSGELLNKVSNVFFNLSSSNTTDSIQGIAKVVSPLLSAHNDNIFLNAAFFQRVKTLNDQKDQLNLTVEQAKLLDN